MAIKRILGGKSKNLCDVAHLLTLPLDKTLEGQGYLRVLINAEPNTTYTFSRENANQINIGTTYLVITAYDDVAHNNWLNHDSAPFLCNKSATLTTNSDGKLWIMFSGDVYYKYWQKNLNQFGYIQLELGSAATEYVPYELTSYKSIMKVSDVCQLVDKGKFMASGTKNGITWVSNGDGSITLNGTCTGGFALNPFNQQIPVDQTHIYYTSPYLSINYGGRIDGTYETGGIGYIKASAQPTKFNTVFYIWIDKDKSFSNVTTYVNIDDLTEMFGAGNEPKTIAEFKAKFPNDYYPYSPSCFITSFDERMPCKTKNLFDPQINLWKAGISTLNYDNGIYYTKDYASRIIDLTNADKDYQLSFQIKRRDRGTEYAYNASWILSKDGKTIYYGKGKDSETFVKLSCTLVSGSTYTLMIYNSVYLGYVQLEKGSTATDYVPYGYV